MLIAYQVDAARYLRSFDGVAPGTAGPVVPPGPTTPAGPTPPPAVPKTILPILPVQYFKPVPIDPKLAQVTLQCTPDIDAGDCHARMLAYYLFKGRNAGKASAAAKAKAKPVLIASVTATIPNGKTRKLKLRFTKAGTALVARGKSVKIALDLTITRGTRSATKRFTTTLKARRTTRR
jgi:hypothetical protein